MDRIVVELDRTGFDVIDGEDEYDRLMDKRGLVPVVDRCGRRWLACRLPDETEVLLTVQDETRAQALAQALLGAARTTSWRWLLHRAGAWHRAMPRTYRLILDQLLFGPIGVAVAVGLPLLLVLDLVSPEVLHEAGNALGSPRANAAIPVGYMLCVYASDCARWLARRCPYSISRLLRRR